MSDKARHCRGCTGYDAGLRDPIRGTCPGLPPCPTCAARLNPFPIQDGPSVPWAVMTPHEAQCKENHGGQSLQDLAYRGGLSAAEAYCVVMGLQLFAGRTEPDWKNLRERWFEFAEKVNLSCSSCAEMRAEVTARQSDERRLVEEIARLRASTVEAIAKLLEPGDHFGIDDEQTQAVVLRADDYQRLTQALAVADEMDRYFAGLATSSSITVLCVTEHARDFHRRYRAVRERK